MEEGLKHVFNKNTQVIILGTFPSVKSREVCYYNNPNNSFWEIIANLYNNKQPLTDKNERYACLLKNGLGLWDVIHSCSFEEKSSLDSKIMKETIVYNDFELLKQQCPALKCIVFNSKNAKKLFDRYLKTKAPEGIKDWLNQMTNNSQNILPSTSSANARMRKEDKIKEWGKFLTKYAKK